MNCSICISINAMRADKMEALNTIIDAENNHELRKPKPSKFLFNRTPTKQSNQLNPHPLQRIFLLNLRCRL